jgi:hypothetical protein
VLKLLATSQTQSQAFGLWLLARTKFKSHSYTSIVRANTQLHAKRVAIAETYANLEWFGMGSDKCFEILVDVVGEGWVRLSP